MIDSRIQEQQPLLSITEVYKTINDQEVIKGFTLDIMPGEVLCLLGNNGSGKTTLVNLLTGLT